MAEIVVTGGCGFLGSNLVKQLVSDRYEACATYNYTPPENPERTRYLSYFRCDVTDFYQCRKLMMQETPIVLYHLVAQPIVTAAQRDPLLTLELTTRGTWNILEAVRQSKIPIKAIVFVSSDKVYGDNTAATEDSPLAATDHPYNVAKMAADVITQMYVKSYGLPVVISRSANLYGPGDFHWDRLVPATCRDIVDGRPTIIRSNGKQMRDYIHISDGVRALTSMAAGMIAKAVTPGEVFNFGSKEMYSVLDVVHKLLKVGGRIDLTPVVMGQAKDEIPAQHIDYTHAFDRIGWFPKVELEDGLKMTLDWYRAWLTK